MPDTVLKRITLEDVFKRMKEIKQLNSSRTETLYIEMHREALTDLICDPVLDSYITRQGIIGVGEVENVLGGRVFTHEDSSKRFVLTFTYRTDVLMGDNNA